jgi:PhzF family phenazine biosynthesis protein
MAPQNATKDRTCRQGKYHRAKVDSLCICDILSLVFEPDWRHVPMKFYIVDAFTESLFGGNPAGVVLLAEGAGFPDEKTMLLTAAELRYSETAFVKTCPDGSYHTRYFTPTNEVDLCGHATIASFTVLALEGKIQPGQDCLNKTLAGDLWVHCSANLVMMDMAIPQDLGKIQSQDALLELYTTMGIVAEPILAIDTNGQAVTLFPTIISTGLPDIILPVSSAAMLSQLNPDYEALSALSAKYGVVGVHAFALPGQDEQTSSEGQVTAYCRNFAPLYGIPEEAATGTSNGALTYYLYSHGLMIPGGRASYIQGREMNRPSRIESLLEIKDAVPTIQVGGTGVVLAKGEIFI